MKELEKIREILKGYHMPNGDKDRVLELAGTLEKERDELKEENGRIELLLLKVHKEVLARTPDPERGSKKIHLYHRR